MKCLLIDDNPIDLLVNERVLSSVVDKSEIVKVQSGEEALRLLENPENLPQIILLDISMPAMSGFDFLEAYKKIHSIRHSQIAVYILSSSLDPDDIRKAETEKYVKAFLQKPLKPEDLKKIKQL